MALPTWEHSLQPCIGCQRGSHSSEQPWGLRWEGQGEAPPARMTPLPFTNELSLTYMGIEHKSGFDSAA